MASSDSSVVRRKQSFLIGKVVDAPGRCVVFYRTADDKMGFNIWSLKESNVDDHEMVDAKQNMREKLLADHVKVAIPIDRDYSYVTVPCKGTRRDLAISVALAIDKVWRESNLFSDAQLEKKARGEHLLCLHREEGQGVWKVRTNEVPPLPPLLRTSESKTVTLKTRCYA